MQAKSLPHYYTFAELAEMLDVPESHLRHLFARNHLRPCWYLWRPKWPAPRFPEWSISEWERLLDQFPVGTFRGDPPKLEPPSHTIREGRRGATKQEIELFLKFVPSRERARLRSLED